MRPYLARVEQEWIALGRNILAGRKLSILSLVTRFATMFPDQKEAMAQAIEAELSDAGKTKQGKNPGGRKPALRPNGNGEESDALPGQQLCNYSACVNPRAPNRKACFFHLEKHREYARLWSLQHMGRGKSWYRKRRESGLCLSCPTKATSVRCADCAKIHRERSLASWRKKADARRSRRFSARLA